MNGDLDKFKLLLMEYFELQVEIKEKLDRYNLLEKRINSYRSLGYTDESTISSIDVPPDSEKN